MNPETEREKHSRSPQTRRASVSVASKIVEGCARNSQADFVRFLDRVFGSIRKAEYPLTIARRLGYTDEPVSEQLSSQADETARILNGLIRSLRSSD
ncbi:four helix bundle protein [Planctomycetes bacterium CA13]|uniref:four helix bundle protein n=1 Tax=Novipirellula herctigrandis TaxID=2527986 RepID=UPI0011B73CC8